ncbi:MAG: hypothetical protein BGO78_08315 [Chloroflexi bacterium 44-23]|nr:MAG: hypothetical protein BGO78_08315 [Chloroflexi bacterium 44-23]
MTPNLENIAKGIIIAGVLLVVVGGIIFGLSRLFNWKSLPGTLHLQTGNFTCIIPILASILLSIVLTILLNLIIRFMNR